MAKAIRYSLHAEEVISQRELLKDWIVAAIETPDWTEPDRRDAEVQRRFKHIIEKPGRILRVACVEGLDEIRVISAFIDRGARRLK